MVVSVKTFAWSSIFEYKMDLTRCTFFIENIQNDYCFNIISDTAK